MPGSMLCPKSMTMKWLSVPSSSKTVALPSSTLRVCCSGPRDRMAFTWMLLTTTSPPHCSGGTVSCVPSPLTGSSLAGRRSLLPTREASFSATISSWARQKRLLPCRPRASGFLSLTRMPTSSRRKPGKRMSRSFLTTPS